jgi:hypothetical protein
VDSGQHGPADATAELGRLSLISILTGGGDSGPVHGRVSAECEIHVDGACIDWRDACSLAEAYSATFSFDDVDVVKVATWRDKVMVAYEVRYGGPAVVDSWRGTAYMTVTDGTISEAWLLDDWHGWLERQFAS